MREVLKSQDISSLLKVSEPCARQGLGVSGYVHCKSPRRVCGEQFPKLSRNFLPTTFFFLEQLLISAMKTHVEKQIFLNSIQS